MRNHLLVSAKCIFPYVPLIFLNLPVLMGALADSAGTLPTAWNAGFVDMGWVTNDFTKSEVQQRQWTVVPHAQKDPLQGFLQCSRRVCLGDFPQR